MFHSKLRQAIAKAFPERYTWLTWPKLLPDFVDSQLKALTLAWMRQRSQPDLPEPTLSAVLQEAIALLAKRQKLSYAFLALSHYEHLHQFGALTVQNEQLRALNKVSLKDLFASLTPPFEEDTYRDYLLRIILLQLVGVDQLDEDNGTLLATYIEAEAKAHQKKLDDYYELTDGDGRIPPNPSEEFVGAIIIQALFNQQTFESLAYQVFDLKKENEAIKFHCHTLEKLAARYKDSYEQLLPVAENLSQQVEECRKGQCLPKRQN